MQYEILGPVRVIDNGETIDIGSRKQRTLLALLVVNANRVVTTERIIDELWPNDADGHENALWVYISRLRSLLDPERSRHGGAQTLQTKSHGYVLNVAANSVDSHRFESVVSEANRVAKDNAGRPLTYCGRPTHVGADDRSRTWTPNSH